MLRDAEERRHAGTTELANHIESAWDERRRIALEWLDGELTGDFHFPAPAVRLFDVTPDLTVRVAPELTPPKKHGLERLLNYALTANELAWDALFADDGNGRLSVRPEGLDALRSELEAYDPSGRISTLEGGCLSDEAIRLLLRARWMNLVAPAGLWAEIGLFPDPGTPWRLPLAERYAASPPRPATD